VQKKEQELRDTLDNEVVSFRVSMCVSSNLKGTLRFDRVIVNLENTNLEVRFQYGDRLVPVVCNTRCGLGTWLSLLRHCIVFPVQENY
jgi:hypothetical protein